MDSKWSDLSSILVRTEYDAKMTDRHYGATAPLPAKPCRCELPGFMLDRDGGETRCWKCGARPTDAAAYRS